jgi:hypothetical protein
MVQKFKVKEPNVHLLDANIKEGFVIAGFGIHELAYILKGLSERVNKYESMGKLADDDEISFEFNKRLLAAVESIRNAALPQ